MSGKISANFLKSSLTVVILDRKLLPPGCVWGTKVVLLKPVRAFTPVLLPNIYGITKLSANPFKKPEGSPASFVPMLLKFYILDYPLLSSTGLRVDK